MARYDKRNGCKLGHGAAAAVLTAAMAICLTVAVPSAAWAEEENDLPETYQLPLEAAAARPDVAPTAEKSPVATAVVSPADAAASDSASSADSGAATGSDIASDAKADPNASVDATDADAAEAKADSAAAKEASAGDDAAAAAPASAARTVVTPASFTITGKKYLIGRDLKADEFSFRIVEAGVASVPLNSDLPKKLREGSSLSDAEKYTLVTESGLAYYPSATQPMPPAATVGNAADGTITFGPLTFDATALGETATQRHSGAIFCYTISEVTPSNADGTAKEGTTTDEQGRTVYDGITYDDSVKRVYIYAYETGDESDSTRVVLVPLGDATFDGVPVKTASGEGRGFVNTFNGAVLDSFTGAVSLEDSPIAAGEFRFDVRKVGENGKELSDQSVSCEASKGGSNVAPVFLLNDASYYEEGRFFYAIHQVESARSVASSVELDETSYVVTVEVTKDDAGQLEAAVTAVRKKPADSDQWTDVDLSAKPSPVVWHNTLKAAADEGSDAPAASDKPSTDDESEGATTEGTDNAGSAAATTPAQGAADGTGDATPDQGSSSEADQPESPSHEAASSDDSASGGEGTSDASGTAEQAQEASGASSADAGNAATDASKAPGAFAQTGDNLKALIMILLVIVIASGIALFVANRHRNRRS